MANSSKVPVFILIVLLLVAFITLGLGYVTLDKEKKKNVVLTQTIEKLEDEKRQVAEKNEDLSRELARAEENLIEYKNRIASITAEVQSERKAKDAAIIELSQIKDEIAALKSTRASLEDKLKAGTETINAKQKELDALKTAKDELEQKLRDLKTQTQESMQLDKIVVGQQETDSAFSQDIAPKTAEAKTGRLEGKVLVVNKEYEFIVVNLGRKDNINVGEKLDVISRDRKIGEVKIAEARDTMSVATPVSKGLMKRVREEDKVVK